RRSVIHRRIRNFLPRELAHQSLKFKDGLERALRNLRLIRRVGSEKLAPLNDRVRHYRAQMIVNASSKKAGISIRILRRALLEILDHLGLRIWPRDFQSFAQPKTLRNTGK